MDRATLHVKARIPVGFAPRSVTLNPTTGRIYVLNGHKLATPTVVELTVIDRASMSVVTTIPLSTGQAATDVAVNSKTNRVYVSNGSQGRIHVINGATNAELDPILIGPGPQGMSVTRPPIPCTSR